VLSYYKLEVNFVNSLLQPRFLLSIFLCLFSIFGAASAEKLSTSITNIHSGQFPIINTHIKIFCNEPVTLSREDFTLFEDEKPVKDFSITIARPDQYYMLIIDRSSSIKADMPVIKRAVLQFLQTIPAEVIIGVISFASDVQLEHEFSRDRKSIFKAVQKIRAWGGTTLFDSIYEGMKRLQKVGKSTDLRTIICLSDGADMNPRGTGPMSIHKLKDVTELAEENSIRVITIGLGQTIDEKSLKALANQTKGAYLCAPTSKQLSGAYQAVSKRARLETYYAVEHTSPNPKRDGTTRKIQIVSKYKGLQDQGKGSYIAPSTPPPEAEKPEKSKYNIPNRPLEIEPRLHGIEPRLHGIEHRLFELSDVSEDYYSSRGSDGCRVGYNSVSEEFSIASYENGERTGLYGDWKPDGTPVGYHGNKLNDKWHGQVTLIHRLVDFYELRTYDQGVEHGWQAQYKFDGTPKGRHGNKVNGEWHGQVILIHHPGANLYEVETYDHGIEHGPHAEYTLDGTPRGRHGNKVNGEWHGQVILIHPPAANLYEVETYDHGIEHGPHAEYTLDGTPRGYHGEMYQGKWHGKRLSILLDGRINVEYFNNGRLMADDE
jgi:antitoxin component YwqK of YwqJK toxin-antitoxin module